MRSAVNSQLEPIRLPDFGARRPKQSHTSPRRLLLALVVLVQASVTACGDDDPPRSSATSGELLVGQAVCESQESMTDTWFSSTSSDPGHITITTQGSDTVDVDPAVCFPTCEGPGQLVCDDYRPLSDCTCDSSRPTDPSACPIPKMFWCDYVGGDDVLPYAGCDCTGSADCSEWEILYCRFDNWQCECVTDT